MEYRNGYNFSTFHGTKGEISLHFLYVQVSSVCLFLNDDGRVWNDLAMTHSDSFFILE